jgi:hypothetical protein
MSLPTDYCGLLAAAPVKWLLDNEPEVRRAVGLFTLGKFDQDYVDVALPPSWLEIMRARTNRKHKIELPCVRLKLKMVHDHISGIPHVLVTCSDAEMEEIVDMARAVEAKQRETALKAEIANTH